MVKEGIDAEEFVALYGRTREAADALHAKAAEIHEMAQDLERLTKDTPHGTPARG